jgi:hypothetical protein
MMGKAPPRIRAGQVNYNAPICADFPKKAQGKKKKAPVLMRTGAFR